MTDTTIRQITLVYRGETQQFNTVSLAAHFLRQDRIRVGWFHTIKATVEFLKDDKPVQARHLKGGKFDILKELAQIEENIKRSPA